MTRKTSQKFTRAKPSEKEQARRVAWGKLWGGMLRDTLRQRGVRAK